MNGKPWIPAEDRALRTLYPHIRTEDVSRIMGRPLCSIYNHAEQLGVEKSEAFRSSPLSGRNVKGHAPHGERTRFKKGQIQANKGLRRPGWAPGRMAETQFKKGSVSKRWDQEIFVVGCLRINSDGILEIKVAPGARQWVILARYVWATERGPIPPGHVVRVKNGDPYDVCDVNNLEIVTRAENMRRNSYHTNYPKEIGQLIQLRGALIRKINRRERQREE